MSKLFFVLASSWAKVKGVIFIFMMRDDRKKRNDHASRRRKRKALLTNSKDLREDSSSKACSNKDRKRLTCHPLCFLQNFLSKMDKNTKVWITGIALFVCMSILFLGLYVSIYAKGELIFCVDLNGRATCHATDTTPYRYYGTKTSYHIAVPNNTYTNLDIGSCKPILFYLLSRHATRYPDGDQIEDMQKFLPGLKDRIVSAFVEGRSSICSHDIERLKSWRLTYVPEDDNTISESGKEEATLLAQRLRNRFPDVLNKSYNPQYYEFAYTSRERTHTTAQAFEEGLFGKLRARYVQGKVNDKVLQFHMECKSFQKKCNTTIRRDLEELNRFEHGLIRKKMISSIIKRLGFNVTNDEIDMMMRACVFGYALQDSDAWCAIFSRDELKVLEYGEDIDDYYKDSYGNAINYEQACPVVNYVVDLLKSADNETATKAVLHFSHAGAVKKVYTRFGLFKDEKPLLADDMCYQQGRKWRSSLITPFTSNLAFILFQCDSSRKVVALQNEQPVIVDGCNSVFCPVEDFFQKYNGIAENCDIKRMCCSCCND